MENKINVAELLKDCPSGMELDCTMYDSVTLLNVNDREDITFPIKVLREDGNYIALTKYGQYTYADFAKCVIFPKGKTTWEGFHKPFEDGDIVTWEDRGSLVACIYKERKNTATFNHHIALYKGGLGIVVNGEIALTDDELCFATEEEKKKLFDAIKENGYKWNPETKTLETLTKFKVGNRIRFKKNHNYTYTITDIREKENKYECGKTFVLRFSEQDDWELVPTKFDITTLKTFDKVLVRHNENNNWRGSFFSHIDDNLHYHCYKYVTIAGKSYPMCIPYEGNEYLLGTTNDCDEYFKNW